jgi:hypothetical protein
MYPDQIASVGNGILLEARRLSGREWEMRDLFKKARLPRFAKAITTSPS